MCCKRYHIIFSTFSLEFKCEICVQKDVIHNYFKNHILVTWLATDLLILRKWCAGLKNQITLTLLKIWPANRFSMAKSYNFLFHKNDVMWHLSANGYQYVNSGAVYYLKSLNQYWNWRFWSLILKRIYFSSNYASIGKNKSFKRT